MKAYQKKFLIAAILLPYATWALYWLICTAASNEIVPHSEAKYLVMKILVILSTGLISAIHGFYLIDRGIKQMNLEGRQTLLKRLSSYLHTLYVKYWKWLDTGSEYKG